jgi:hypothetical protein
MISAIRCCQIRDPGRLGVSAGRPADSLPADGVIAAAPFGNRAGGLTLAVNRHRPGPGGPRPGAPGAAVRKANRELVTVGWCQIVRESTRRVISVN